MKKLILKINEEKIIKSLGLDNPKYIKSYANYYLAIEYGKKHNLAHSGNGWELENGKRMYNVTFAKKILFPNGVTPEDFFKAGYTANQSGYDCYFSKIEFYRGLQDLLVEKKGRLYLRYFPPGDTPAVDKLLTWILPNTDVLEIQASEMYFGFKLITDSEIRHKLQAYKARGGNIDEFFIEIKHQ